jgi:hypothetical protein
MFFAPMPVQQKGSKSWKKVKKIFKKKEKKPTSGTQTLTKRQSSDVFNRSMSGCGHAGPNWVATTVLFAGWICSGI